MRGLNIDKFYQGSVLRPIFQNSVFDIRPMKGAGDDIFAMMSSFYLQLRSIFEQFTMLSGNMTIFLLSYAVFRTLVPLRRLKAICLKRVSMEFLINLVNLARKALLWRWEIPKYCSTSAPRCCTKDEGRPLEAGLQELASNHLKLQW